MTKPRYDRDGYQAGTDYLEETYVLAQPRYLVGKYRDKVVDDLRTDLEAERRENRTFREQADEAKAIAKDIEKALDAKEAELDRAKEDADRYRSQKGEAEKRMRKMEEDIAKIRTAVGDIIECQSKD